MNATEMIQRLWRRAILFNGIPGMARVALLQMRGAQIGRRTLIPPRTLFTWPHQVKLGNRCILQPDIFFNFDHYWTPGPSIVIGDRVFIGRGCEFNIRNRLDIGDDCLIASGCTFSDSNHDRNSDQPMNRQPVESKPIAVGRNVWIGARCVILQGVAIGDGAVVGAGAVVTKSIPPGEVWGGVPAKPLKQPVKPVCGCDGSGPDCSQPLPP